MKTQASSKTVQGMKVKIESIKKSQTEGNLERKNLRTKTVTSEANLTNRIEEMEERISDIEDKIEEMDPHSKQTAQESSKERQHQAILQPSRVKAGAKGVTKWAPAGFVSPTAIVVLAEAYMASFLTGCTCYLQAISHRSWASVLLVPSFLSMFNSAGGYFLVQYALA